MSPDRIRAGGLWGAVPAPAAGPPNAPTRTEQPVNPLEGVSDEAAHAALARWYADGSPWSPTETADFEPGEIEAMRAAISAADQTRRATLTDPASTGCDSARAQVERLLTLLDLLVDPDPCWLDGHGECQTHNYWSEPGQPCPVAQSVGVLIEAGRRTADADPA